MDFFFNLLLTATSPIPPDRRCWALWLVTAPFLHSNCQRDFPWPASLCAISCPDSLALTGRFSTTRGRGVWWGVGQLRTTDTWSCPKRGDGVRHWLFLPLLHCPPTHTPQWLYCTTRFESHCLHQLQLLSRFVLFCFVLLCFVLFCFALFESFLLPRLLCSGHNCFEW